MSPPHAESKLPALRNARSATKQHVQAGLLPRPDDFADGAGGVERDPAYPLSEDGRNGDFEEFEDVDEDSPKTRTHKDSVGTSVSTLQVVPNRA